MNSSLLRAAPHTNSLIHPYALLKAPDEVGAGSDADVEDSFALVLPIKTAQTVGSDAGEVVPVVLRDGVATWVGLDGKTHQIGIKGSPLEAKAVEALQRDEGLLVLFMDMSSGQSEHWSVFKAE